jgi:hypothetical protein
MAKNPKVLQMPLSFFDQATAAPSREQQTLRQGAARESKHPDMTNQSRDLRIVELSRQG